ncbi:MAG: hydroxymethylbilane synthase [Deltaproteobacteria bacterium]|nr:hydroxymethylbilane synthase [Deltaproteobacteria bacterium]
MKLRLCTRRSALALAQARAYAKALQRTSPGLDIEEVHVVTSGDRFQDRPLVELGGKGLFVKEIEQALLEGRADFAVHSIKDVPAELAPGLVLAAVPARADPRDVLVTATGCSLVGLARGARIGTSSLRRRTLLLAVRPDLEIVPLRGNVDTRLRKLHDGLVDAVVLAQAGLLRLGLERSGAQILDPAVLLPAVGQGALGIECRAADAALGALLGRTADLAATVCVSAERAFMAAVGGSCRLPVAAYGVRDGGELWLRGAVAQPDGTDLRRGERRSSWPAEPGEAGALGRELGAELGRQRRP